MLINNSIEKVSHISRVCGDFFQLFQMRKLLNFRDGKKIEPLQ